jgi:hypothetical protein
VFPQYTKVLHALGCCKSTKKDAMRKDRYTTLRKQEELLN